MALYGFNRADARTLRGVAQSVRQTSNKNQSINYPTPNGILDKKSLVRFTLDSTLATSDESKSATIVTQYGDGFTADITVTITVYNLLTSTASVYVFSGASGDAGLAIWDSGVNYRIIQLEC